MNNAHTAAPTAQPPIRLWPALVAAALFFLRLIIPLVWANGALIAIICGAAGTLVVLVWWLFLSRVPWPDRLALVALTAAVFFATRPFLDKSILGAGMGVMYPMYALQTVSVGLIAWAVIVRRMSAGTRRVLMVVTVVLACGGWTLMRTDGIIGAGSQLAWRWTPTAEERLLAQAPDEPPAPRPPAAVPPASASPAAPAAAAPAPAAPAVPAEVDLPAEWSGFRGPARDSVIHGVRIDTDWSKTPPVELWRHPIGPGWSSFSVAGNLIFTQEQRGDDEIVSCYDLTTGKPVWRHRDATRFWESNGGAGPRATPTLGHGRVYTFGATGILNALDARTGIVVWSRNVANDSHTKVPMWGFTSSPLLVDDEVIVAAAGTLTGYDRATGNPRWVGPKHRVGYSSPQLVTTDGVAQVVLLSADGATSVEPAGGKVLWEYDWVGGAIVQPAVTADGDVLINSIAATGGVGIRRLAVAHAAAGGWRATERWTSTGLKPYFNDFVVHHGHAFGFDGSILSCIDLADGTRTWKGGRYGAGQLILLADQDLLLVLSEDGELALVAATPDKFTELARVPAIDGKTWNHPVLVGNVLLVRNGQEMAAFRLAPASR